MMIPFFFQKWLPTKEQGDQKQKQERQEKENTHSSGIGESIYLLQMHADLFLNLLKC